MTRVIEKDISLSPPLTPDRIMLGKNHSELFSIQEHTCRTAANSFMPFSSCDDPRSSNFPSILPVQLRGGDLYNSEEMSEIDVLLQLWVIMCLGHGSHSQTLDLCQKDNLRIRESQEELLQRRDLTWRSGAEGRVGSARCSLDVLSRASWYPHFLSCSTKSSHTRALSSKGNFSGLTNSDSSPTCWFLSSLAMSEFECVAGSSYQHLGEAALDSAWTFPHCPEVTPLPATSAFVSSIWKTCAVSESKVATPLMSGQTRLEMTQAGTSKHRR